VDSAGPEQGQGAQTMRPFMLGGDGNRTLGRCQGLGGPAQPDQCERKHATGLDSVWIVGDGPFEPRYRLGGPADRQERIGSCEGAG